MSITNDDTDAIVVGRTQTQFLVQAWFHTSRVVLGCASRQHRANITCLTGLSRALGIMHVKPLAQEWQEWQMAGAQCLACDASWGRVWNPPTP